MSNSDECWLKRTIPLFCSLLICGLLICSQPICSSASAQVASEIVAEPSIVRAEDLTPAKAQLERLRASLQGWSLGRSPSRDEVKSVYSSMDDPRRSSETECIRSVEEDLSRYLETNDLSLLPTLTLWHTQMLLESIAWAGQPTLRSRDFDRIGDRLKTYHRRAARRVTSLSRTEVDYNAALMWTGLAEVFARHGSRSFYQLARVSLDRALEIDDELLPARYLHAWVGERLLPSLDMMRPWRELMEDYPERAEYRLRFSINAAAAVRREKAFEQLEVVARGGGAEWMRALAYETWVQLLLDPTTGGSSDNEDAARQILREARQNLSPWPSLDLLASSLDLNERRGNALRLAERVEAHVWPEGEVSPQLRYELPNPDELAEMREHLIHMLRDGQRRLIGTLELIDSRSVLRRRSLQACD